MAVHSARFWRDQLGLLGELGVDALELALEHDGHRLVAERGALLLDGDLALGQLLAVGLADSITASIVASARLRARSISRSLVYEQQRAVAARGLVLLLGELPLLLVLGLPRPALLGRERGLGLPDRDALLGRARRCPC